MEGHDLLEKSTTNALGEALRLLREAQKLLDAPERFTKGAWGRDKNDEPVPAESPQARKWCVAGAVLCAEARLHGTPALSRTAANDTAPWREHGPKRVETALALLALPALRVYAYLYRDELERAMEAGAGRAREEGTSATTTEIAAAVNDDERIAWEHIAVVFEFAIVATQAELRKRRQAKPDRPRKGGAR
jgi:hypothetical protein